MNISYSVVGEAEIYHWLLGQNIRAEAALEISEFVTIDSLMTVQNHEGIAVHPLPGGSAYIYLTSDDTLQRTLLLMFEYRG